MAGVSYQTVSRVVNDQPGVASATQERVRRAMRTLGYRPNSAARSLVTGSSRTIGVISFRSTLFGPLNTVYSIEDQIQRAGYYVVSTTLPRFDRERYSEAVDWLLRQGVEGIVVVEPEGATTEGLAEPANMAPFVSVGGVLDDTEALVSVDGDAGARKAVRYLLDLGHRTVWHVAGPSSWAAARARERGWQHELAAAAAPVPPPLRGDWHPRSGYAAGRQLAEAADVTAVFVANDHMALGVLRALHEAGRHVPGDISVVGFDDIPEAAYLTPPLTTLHQNFQADAEQAIAGLIDEIKGKPSERQPVQVVPELIVRASSGPPAGR